MGRSHTEADCYAILDQVGNQDDQCCHGSGMVLLGHHTVVVQVTGLQGQEHLHVRVCKRYISF